MMCVRTNIMIEFLGQLGQERWSTRDSNTPMTPCFKQQKNVRDRCSHTNISHPIISYLFVSSSWCNTFGPLLYNRSRTTSPQRAKRPDNAGFSLHTRWAKARNSSFKSIPAGFPDGCLGCRCVWDPWPIEGMQYQRPTPKYAKCAQKFGKTRRTLQPVALSVLKCTEDNVILLAFTWSSSWCFRPLGRILVQMDHFPK